MMGVSRIATAVLAAAVSIRTCVAQSAPVMYTDPSTGIKLGTWVEGNMTFGLALPSNALTTDASEYIGILKCLSGWCGISHGQSGQMTEALLLMAWNNGNEVLTSFRYATGYTMPAVYTGVANVTQISSNVTSDGFELIYRCTGCFSWDQDGATGSVSTSSGDLILGWADSSATPTDPDCPNSISFTEHTAFGQWGAPLAGLASSNYTEWTALATKTVNGDCGGTTPTATPSPTCDPNMDGSVYDYVIVGSGAGGIPMADRLSEAGHSVLLLEKGPPSLGMWGGDMKPHWLDKTDLTRFDIPGLCNEIWVNSGGVACTDTDQMAGCVLGGGTAINAGLWWKPNPADWDDNFPEGWHDSDLTNATAKVFSRIPGTIRPSMDGKLYLPQGKDMLEAALGKAGWTNIEQPNTAPASKNKTYGSTTYMFSDGERAGPMATYLKTAAARDNFELWLNTPARRALRNGSTVTGVELDCTVGNNTFGTVKLTPGTGRLIVSAGTFGSAKFLMRSGIGPQDQLEIVKSSTDGPNMISNDSWIYLPVGYNLDDHVNTDTYITDPIIVFYDFYAAWTDPIPSDASAYLNNRTGILTQAAPNIGPIFWDEIPGADGVTRQIMWTARIEGADETNSNNTMIMSQYLGRGATSRGRMTIQPALDTVVSDPPYLKTADDKAAVIAGIDNLRKAITGYVNVTWALPAPNTTTTAYVDSIDTSPATRRANHWIGTNKMGLDDGRMPNGTAVVDTDTKIYGMDNMFVVDASIFPGMMSSNPSAMIVAAAENAAVRILALEGGPESHPVTEVHGGKIIVL
ncbi:hypothetical protein F5Y16DRAFT_119294 [Xylariaceae sp. FL0255]|nr:hypothetical protein F5Y16DRAFT_119294 [Xylariaceae sp. FL0255]